MNGGHKASLEMGDLPTVMQGLGGVQANDAGSHALKANMLLTRF